MAKILVTGALGQIGSELVLALREKFSADEVVAVSLGGAKCQETLRTALAMGADRAIHVETEADLQPLAVAKLLKAVVDKESPGLVIMGKQAIDDDATGASSEDVRGFLQWRSAY